MLGWHLGTHRSVKQNLKPEKDPNMMTIASQIKLNDTLNTNQNMKYENWYHQKEPFKWISNRNTHTQRKDKVWGEKFNKTETSVTQI